MRFRIRFEHALLIAGAAWMTLPGCSIESEDPPVSPPTVELDDGHDKIDLDAENGPRIDTPPGTLAAPAPVSNGWYSIPYEAGVRVRVSRDHITHSPENRIDMSGISGGPYRIVAAAAGTVRFIEDSHSETGSCADNNYVWLEHANGEWTKYSHVARNSATVTAGLSVGEAVDAGQLLGIEDDVGCASGPHLHHEVAVPTDPSNPINPVGGYIIGENRVPKVCGIEGNRYVAGTTYTVAAVRPGEVEYSRHGVPDSTYQADFDALRNCGYRLDWIDGFERDGQAHFNAVWHPNTDGTDWVAHRRMTLAELNSRIEDYVDGQNYELVHVDVYNVGNAVRYAAIFKRGASISTTHTYHGLTADAHQLLFDNLTAAGWNPRVVSATSIASARTYAAIYTQQSIGGWFVRSFLTETDYLSTASAQESAGRRLRYLNSYVHNGAIRYTAIWASSAPSQVDDRIGMSTSMYTSQWSSHHAAGWSTGAVSGTQVNGTTRYAAYWQR